MQCQIRLKNIIFGIYWKLFSKKKNQQSLETYRFCICTPGHRVMFVENQKFLSNFRKLLKYQNL